MTKGKKQIEFPVYGYGGLLLIIIFWGLNWGLSGLRSHWGFFPLWLGYILFMDARVYYRRQTSLISRNVFMFIMLFIISIPGWWLFEAINQVTRNWIYLGRDAFTTIQFVAFASLSFSTVIPAVFITAEFFSGFKRIQQIPAGFVIHRTNKNYFIIFFIGILMLLSILIFPQHFFPLIWISVYFIIDPLNHLLGNKTLLHELHEGRWNTYIALSTGALMCGFFWEMWNIYSYPKWVYELPLANFGHIFEMPVLGYMGYIPFAWELYAIYQLVAGILFREKSSGFINLES